MTQTSNFSDTISAISTPLGEAGLGIVRLSGKSAFQIADKIFQGKTKPTQAESHTVHYGKAVDPISNEILDEVLLIIMQAPHTYTVEDVVEISCHGGPLVLQKILHATVAAGARLAEPGEFTLRAFVNGRIDLAQAEAVADVIRAKSDSSLKSALAQLEGRLSTRIEVIRAKLLDLMAKIEAQIDFVEQDIPAQDKKEMLKIIGEVENGLLKLVETYEEGKILKEGLNVVIVGKPNVGKSSLLNSLLQKDRAIVTAIPGTTRDVISDYVNFDGILVRLVDTAGFRISGDEIEIEGIKRAEKEIQKGDLILLVIDCTQSLTEEEKILEKKLQEQNYLVVLNKIDLVEEKTAKNFENQFSNRTYHRVSALLGEGMDALKKSIVSRISRMHREGEVVLTNLRHKECLETALDFLEKSKQGLEKNLSLEFIALDCRKALDKVGEVIGKVYTDDILNRIFSQFCIGK